MSSVFNNPEKQPLNRKGRRNLKRLNRLEKNVQRKIIARIEKGGYSPQVLMVDLKTYKALKQLEELRKENQDTDESAIT